MMMIGGSRRGSKFGGDQWNFAVFGWEWSDSRDEYKDTLPQVRALKVVLIEWNTEFCGGFAYTCCRFSSLNCGLFVFLLTFWFGRNLH